MNPAPLCFVYALFLLEFGTLIWLGEDRANTPNKNRDDPYYGYDWHLVDWKRQAYRLGKMES